MNLRSQSVQSTNSVRSKKKMKNIVIGKGQGSQIREGWAVYKPIPAIRLDPIKSVKNTNLKPIKLRKKKNKKRIIMNTSTQQPKSSVMPSAIDSPRELEDVDQD